VLTATVMEFFSYTDVYKHLIYI